jgi:hypothetical protein
MALRLNKDAWASIQRLYEAGASAHELAPQFGITAGAIYRKSHVQGWAKAKRPPEFVCEQLRGISQSMDRLAAALEGVNRKVAT